MTNFPTWTPIRLAALLAALLAVAIAATPEARAAAAGPYKPPGSTSIPTPTPTPIQPKDPPPVISTPNPPPRMAPERVPDLRELAVPGRVVAPIETTALTRRPIINRLENRSTAATGSGVGASLAETSGVKAPARSLLESAKPIL
ncbi:MAG: hypothetical protein IT562_10560 [Alphaproteobacteria bacterium]|nr:hypothetical protein [Alphaproteobacteria bacterium]